MLRVCHTSRNIVSFLFPIAAACLASAVALAGGQDLGDGPSVTGNRTALQGVAPTSLGLNSYAQFKDEQTLNLKDFTLEDGRAVDLQLEQFDIFAPDAWIVVGSAAGDALADRPPVALYRGVVAGEPESSVFLSLSPSAVNGLIVSGGHEHIISSGPFGEALQPLIYDLQSMPDDAMDWSTFTCNAIEPPGWAPPPQGDMDAGRDATPTRCYRTNLAIDTDWEYTGSLFGGDTNASAAYAATLIGAISEIYWRDFRVELQISYLRTWADSADPWDQPDTGTQLEQFRNYWQGMGDVERDLAHFLSGRALGGGMAYAGGVVCSYGWGFGLSANLAGHFPYPLQDHRANNWDPYVVAHEIGHNFAAPHTHDMTPPIDGCGLGDCTNANQGTIMSYCHTCPGGMTNIVLHFHPRMISERVLPYLDVAGDCLASAGPNFSIQPPPSQAVCVGDMVVLSVMTDAVIPTYQWRRGVINLADGPNLIGTNSSTLVILNADIGDSSQYYDCVVDDLLSACEGVSDYAAVFVDTNTAVITVQPQDQSITETQPLWLSVAVEDAVLYTFQWRKDGTPLENDGRVYGATSQNLVVMPTQLSDAGAYDCVITSALGGHCSVVSDTAQVDIQSANQCPGDIDRDGDVDLADLSTLLAHYGMTTGATFEDGDIDGDGDVDLADLSTLLADYARTDC